MNSLSNSMNRFYPIPSSTNFNHNEAKRTRGIPETAVSPQSLRLKLFESSIEFEHSSTPVFQLAQSQWLSYWASTTVPLTDSLTSFVECTLESTVDPADIEWPIPYGPPMSWPSWHPSSSNSQCSLTSLVIWFWMFSSSSFFKRQTAPLFRTEIDRAFDFMQCRITVYFNSAVSRRWTLSRFPSQPRHHSCIQRTHGVSACRIRWVRTSNFVLSPVEILHCGVVSIGESQVNTVY